MRRREGRKKYFVFPCSYKWRHDIFPSKRHCVSSSCLRDCKMMASTKKTLRFQFPSRFFCKKSFLWFYAFSDIISRNSGGNLFVLTYFCCIFKALKEWQWKKVFSSTIACDRNAKWHQVEIIFFQCKRLYFCNKIWVENKKKFLRFEEKKFILFFCGDGDQK